MDGGFFCYVMDSERGVGRDRIEEEIWGRRRRILELSIYWKVMVSASAAGEINMVLLISRVPDE